MAYNDVMLGGGKSTGMFFKAPAGTALPSYPGETPGASWKLVGDVSEDGTSQSFPNGDVLRNWALEPKRKVNTKNGEIKFKLMDTTQNVLETVFGENNVNVTAATSSHGNVLSVTVSPDVSAEPAAYLFLMKDGDRLSMIGTDNGLITNIDDAEYKPNEPVMWGLTIEGTWRFDTDDGQVTS
jgi:hypothetical protein